MKNRMRQISVPPISKKMIGKFVVLVYWEKNETCVARIIGEKKGRLIYQKKEGTNAGKKFSAKYGPCAPMVYDRMCDAMEHSFRTA